MNQYQSSLAAALAITFQSLASGQLPPSPAPLATTEPLITQPVTATTLPPAKIEALIKFLDDSSKKITLLQTQLVQAISTNQIESITKSRDQELMLVFKKLAQDLGIQTGLTTAISLELFSKDAEKIAKAFFTQTHQLLLPRALDVDGESCLYSLGVFTTDKLAIRILPEQITIHGLVVPDKSAKVRIYNQASDMLEIIGNSNEGAILGSRSLQDYLIVAGAGMVVIRDTIATKATNTQTWQKVDPLVIEHATAIRLATLSAALTGKQLPNTYKFEQKAFSSVQIAQLLADYNFLRTTKEGGLEYLIKDLVTRAKRQDQNSELTNSVLKAAVRGFIEAESEEFSALNDLISAETGERDSHHPAYLKNIAANVAADKSFKTIAELLEIAKKHQQDKLLRIFYNSCLDNMESAIQELRAATKRKE